MAMVADPRPADDMAPPGPSLVGQIVAAARRSRGFVSPAETDAAVPARLPPPREQRTPIDRVGAAVALMLIAAPLAIWIDAAWLTQRARTATDTLSRQAAPIDAARADAARAREQLGMAWTQPTIGTTIEAIGRALPADAALLRVERHATGLLSIEVAAPDPDQVTAALRRDPALAELRAVSQTPGDDGMRVTLEQPR